MDYIIEDRSVVEMVVVWEIRQRPWCARSSSDFRRSDTRYLQMTKLHPCHITRDRERETEREIFFLKDYREIFAGIWMISTQRRSPADLLSDCPACTKGDELPEKSTKVACMHASWLLLAMPVLFNHTKRRPLRPASPRLLNFIAGQGQAGRPDQT